MVASDKSMVAEGLGRLCKSLGSSAKADKKLATIVLRNSGRALEICSNIAAAAATKNPRVKGKC